MKLSIENALELMNILHPYIPEDYDDGLDFVGKIVGKIKDTNPVDYVKALALISGGSMQDVIDIYTPEESIEIFGQGLLDNKIIDLRRFYERLTNG